MFTKTDNDLLLRYAAKRLSPPQRDEFTRSMRGDETLTPQTMAFWFGKALEWLEWLIDDPTLAD